MCNVLLIIVLIMILCFFSKKEHFGPFERTAKLLCADLPRSEQIECINKNYAKVPDLCNQQFCKNVCMKEIDGVMIDVTNNPAFKYCAECNRDPCKFYCDKDPNGYMCKVSCGKHKSLCQPDEFIDQLYDIPIHL